MKKIIVITGGTSGIGYAISENLAKEHTVVILAKNSEKLKTVAKKLACDYSVCDVSKWEDVEKSIAYVLEKYEKIDVLINNAGIWIEGELETNDPKRMKATLEVNTMGTMFVSKAVIPAMKKQKSGIIINIISQAGLSAKKDRSVYNGSKWALTGFTKSLQQELTPYGIRVTAVNPGKVKTELFEKIGITKDMSDAIEPKDIAKAVSFVLSFDYPIHIPEIGIKHIRG